jgi:hypothetical protein
MTRTGKIARLPRSIRNELNQRLDDGESGVSILKWLNRLDEVQSILDLFFDGQRINNPNLTAWRQGGFVDWKRHRESSEWVRAVSEQAEQMTDEAGLMPLSDRVSSLAAMALGKLMQNIAAPKDGDTPAPGEFHALMKDLAQLRREDREAARLRIELEHHAQSKEQEARANKAVAAYRASSGRPW